MNGESATSIKEKYLKERAATNILSKIFANPDIYWCMGERGTNISSVNGTTPGVAFITIDGSTEITNEELDFLGQLARNAPRGR